MDSANTRTTEDAAASEDAASGWAYGSQFDSPADAVEQPQAMTSQVATQAAVTAPPDGSGWLAETELSWLPSEPKATHQAESDGPRDWLGPSGDSQVGYQDNNQMASDDLGVQKVALEVADAPAAGRRRKSGRGSALDWVSMGSRRERRRNRQRREATRAAIKSQDWDQPDATS